MSSFIKIFRNNTKPILSIIIALLYFNFLNGAHIGSNYNYSPQSIDPKEKLNEYFQLLNTGLISLINLKKMIHQEQPNSSGYILSTNFCEQLEQINPNIPVVNKYLPDQTVYKKIEENGDYFLIKNKDVQFWTLAKCLKKTTGITFLDDLLNNRRNDHDLLYKMVQKTQDNQNIIYNKYLKYLESISKSKAIGTINDDSKEIKILINNINNKKNISDQIFNRIENQLNKNELPFTPLIKRITLKVNLAFGSSNFNKQLTNESSQELSSGNTNIGVEGSYKLDKHSIISAKINTRKETNIAPYTKWLSGLGFQSKRGVHNYRIRGSILSYRNQSNSNRDYNKTQLFGGINNNVRRGIKYGINYHFLNQKMVNDETRSYNRHKADASFSFSTTKIKNILFNLSLINGSSDNTTYNYLSVMPSINLNFGSGNHKSNLIISMDQLKYQDSDLNSNKRYQIRYATSIAESATLTKRKDIRLVFRNYSNNTMLNYIGFSYRDISNSRDYINKTNRLSFRFRYIPNLIERSHIDIRNASQQGNKLFVNHDINLRIGYPSDSIFIGNLDGYLKFGVHIKGIRFGPTISWHLRNNFKSTESFTFKSEQTSLQYGLEILGIYKYKSILNIRFRASYDSNTSFNKTSDSSSGNSSNTLLSRHPKNIQFNLDAGYLIQKSIELFLKINTFEHQTDNLNDDINTLLESNSSTRIQLGARIKYN